MNTVGTPKMSATENETASEAIAPPAMDVVVQGKIGQKLRETYQQVVNEPIPPRLLALLDELKKKEQIPEAEDRS